MRLADSTVSLSVGPTDVFVYKDLTCQMVWNSTLKQFRAGTDNMSDYFQIKLSDIPSSSGQTLTGDVSWTTSSSVNSLSDLPFEVIQVDSDGNAWLWCRKQRMAMVIRMLR